MIGLAWEISFLVTFELTIDIVYLLYAILASSSLLVLGDGILQLLKVCTGKVGQLLAILEEHEGRHSGNLVLHSNVFTLVHIDLQEDHVGHLLLQCLHLWGNDLAGSTPCGKEVHHNQLTTGLGELLLKGFLGWDGENHG